MIVIWFSLVSKVVAGFEFTWTEVTLNDNSRAVEPLIHHFTTLDELNNKTKSLPHCVENWKRSDNDSLQL